MDIMQWQKSALSDTGYQSNVCDAADCRVQ